MKRKQNSQGKESIRTGTSPEILSQALLDNLYYGQGRTSELATRNDCCDLHRFHGDLYLEGHGEEKVSHRFSQG